MNRISFLHLFNYLPKNIINLLIRIPYRIAGLAELIKKIIKLTTVYLACL